MERDRESEFASELSHRETRRTKRSDSTIIKLFVVARAKLFRGDFIRGARLSASLRSGNKSISLQLKDKWHLPTLIKNPTFGRAPIKQKPRDVLNSPAADAFYREHRRMFCKILKDLDKWNGYNASFLASKERISHSMLRINIVLYTTNVFIFGKTGLNFSAFEFVCKEPGKTYPYDR